MAAWGVRGARGALVEAAVGDGEGAAGAGERWVGRRLRPVARGGAWLGERRDPVGAGLGPGNLRGPPGA